MAALDKNIIITPNNGETTALPNIVFTGGNNVSTTLNVQDDGSLQLVQGNASADFVVKSAVTKALGDDEINVFSIVDSASTPLFEVRQNGDAIIGGVLTVNGTGTSTFAGDVSIGGSLTVEETATVTAELSGTDLTLTGNLVVNGNTTLGNEPTDTLTVHATTSVFSPTTKVLGDDEVNVFSVLDSESVPLFEVRQNGDTVIGGILTVNGSGTSTFAGDVNIGGNLTVDGSITGGTTVDLADDLTISGNLVVNGNTTLGNESTDTLTVHATTSVFSLTTKVLGDDEVNVFSVLDSESVPLFEVRQNGDAIIGGVLTVNGSGTSTFAGNVSIGGSLTVEEDATITANLSGTDLTLTGNLVVNGNTTLGNESTDSITITGTLGSNIIPSVSETYNLGSATKKWNNIYAKNVIADSSTLGGTTGVGGDLIPDVDHTYDLGSATFRFDQGYISTLNANDIKVITDAAIDSENAATTPVFRIIDNQSTPAELFKIMQNGDTIIGGVLTVNGSGTSTFAGDVSIGGSLTVEETATVTAELSGTDLTLTGNLVVNGNTTLGNESTDTLTVTAAVASTVLPATTKTYSLGSETKEWDGIYAHTLTTSSNAIIGGNLTVNGTVTYINTETLSIGDNIIVLNNGLDDETPPTVNAGITVNRGSATDVSFLWDETDDLWTVGAQKLKASEFIGTFNGSFDSTTQTSMDDRYVNVDGDSMTGNLTISGVLSATSKSFVIDHPTKVGYKLRHGSLEGPENGVYVRATVNGKNEFELPEYWVGLVDPDTITVSLTPNGKFQPLYVVSKSISKIVVNADGFTDDEFNFDIIVFAERVDVSKIVVEYQEVSA